MKLTKWLVRIEETVARSLLISIVVLVFAAAVLRSIKHPVSWSVELAQLFFAWFAFLAANQALRRDAHIGVDIFTRKLSPNVNRWIKICHFLLVGIFLAVIAIWSVQLSFKNVNRSLDSLPISYSWVTISVAVGCCLMLITVFGKLKKLFKNENTA